MENSKTLNDAIDGFYLSIQNLCDVLSIENKFENRLQVFGELNIVANMAMHQLIEKGWGDTPNVRNGEKRSEKEDGTITRELSDKNDEGLKYERECVYLRDRVTLLEKALKPILEVNIEGLKKFDGLDYSELLTALVSDSQRIIKEGENK